MVAGLPFAYRITQLAAPSVARASGSGGRSLGRVRRGRRTARAPPPPEADAGEELFQFGHLTFAPLSADGAERSTWDSSLPSVFFLETVDATSSIGKPLLSSVEWMRRR